MLCLNTYFFISFSYEHENKTSTMHNNYNYTYNSDAFTLMQQVCLDLNTQCNYDFSTNCFVINLLPKFLSCQILVFLQDLLG